MVKVLLIDEDRGRRVMVAKQKCQQINAFRLSGLHKGALKKAPQSQR